MADLDVAIFTFTTTEKDAVRALLEPLLDAPTDWTLTPGVADWAISRTLPNSTTVQVLHKHLAKQGNVIAATEFARAADYGNRDAPEYFIVYGCCGAIKKELIGQLFRVSKVSYLSLGEVSKPPIKAPALFRLLQIGIGWLSCLIGESITEIVKVKNKWIVKTDADRQEPLGSYELPAGTRQAPGPLMSLTIPDAYALATDKVIKIPPAAQAPQPSRYAEGVPLYDEGEWTYGEALARCRDDVPGPILIDMETFGIASTMRALALDDRVLVLRVVTDALSNKAKQTKAEQLRLLKSQLPLLARVLATIMGIADDELQHT